MYTDRDDIQGWTVLLMGQTEEPNEFLLFIHHDYPPL